MIDALGMVRGGSSYGQDRIAKFASQDRLKPFVTPVLESRTLTPIEFRTQDGKRIVGLPPMHHTCSISHNAVIDAVGIRSCG
jgi:hypothetical protein